MEIELSVDERGLLVAIKEMAKLVGADIGTSFEIGGEKERIEQGIPAILGGFDTMIECMRIKSDLKFIQLRNEILYKNDDKR